MVDTFLITEKTVVSAKGDGPLVDISPAQSRVLLLELQITGAVEQESLDLSLFAGADEAGLSATPLTAFPQLFYPGSYPLLLELSGHPEIKVLRAHWEVNRWGRGPEKPWFEVSLKVTEVPPELLRERHNRQG